MLDVRFPKASMAVGSLPEGARLAAGQLISYCQPEVDPDDEIVELLRAVGSRSDAAQTATAIADRYSREPRPPIDAVKRWVEAHDSLDGIRACLELDPPREVTVHRLLPHQGKQKLVFLATWNLRQRSIVLKTFAKGAGYEVLSRELHPHPLSMVHPNIIETHLLRNAKGEEFLVERRLPEVLSDEWSSAGLEDSANLLRDLSEALLFLRREELVHGDIKPENIGREASRFILLDFGVCRKASAFLDSAPTGSLRTRAPELLEKKASQTYASDLWALGATVFSTVLGRYPLFRSRSEGTPDTKAEREVFERELARRSREEWDDLVEKPIRNADPHLRDLLASLLLADPQQRWEVQRALDAIEKTLRPYLMTHSERRGRGPLSHKEAEELARFYAEDVKMVRQMPLPELYTLRERLQVTKALDLTNGTGEKFAQLKLNVDEAFAKLTRA